MIDNKINNIRFTPTEIKVICCFTDSATSKPSGIARILNKPVRTIYGHIDRIKIKTNLQTINDLILFVRKSSQYNQLREYFNLQYIEFAYSETAKKIAFRLKPFKIICHITMPLDILESLEKKVIESIELLGIKVVQSKNLSKTDKAHYEGSQIYFHVAHSLDEIKKAQLESNEEKNNTIYLALDGYKKVNLYKDLVQHVVNSYSNLTNLNIATNFLSSAPIEFLPKSFMNFGGAFRLFIGGILSDLVPATPAAARQGTRSQGLRT